MWIAGAGVARTHLPAPPEFPPPADAALRREVDALAVQVARSGDLVEAIARKQAAAAGGKFQFLIHGGRPLATTPGGCTKSRWAMRAVVLTSLRCQTLGWIGA